LTLDKSFWRRRYGKGKEIHHTESNYEQFKGCLKEPHVLLLAGR